jgi:transcriptional regulator with XRE-family HTH domain
MTIQPSVAKRRATEGAARRIGESVSQWRRAQRLTQAELAQRSHSSVRTIAKLESGDATVSLTTVLSVAHTLGLLPAVVEAFDPMQSDFGAALVAKELPRRVRSRD